jgi:hypothetical protein
MSIEKAVRAAAAAKADFLNMVPSCFLNTVDPGVKKAGVARHGSLNDDVSLNLLEDAEK